MGVNGDANWRGGAQLRREIKRYKRDVCRKKKIIILLEQQGETEKTWELKR